MCAGGGGDGMQLGARKMLGKQPGDEREEGLAKFWLVLVRAPTRIKKMDHHPIPCQQINGQGSLCE